jgi:hypothetical protein
MSFDYWHTVYSQSETVIVSLFSSMVSVRYLVSHFDRCGLILSGTPAYPCAFVGTLPKQV